MLNVYNCSVTGLQLRKFLFQIYLLLFENTPKYRKSVSLFLKSCVVARGGQRLET